MTEPIFFTDTDSNNDNNNFCPVKDYTKFDTKTKIYNYSDVSYDEVLNCNDIKNNEDYEDYNGCCIIKDTDPNIKCETYFGSDSHDLGMKYSFPEFEDINYSVCHSKPMRDISFGFGPNQIVNFFQLLLVAIVFFIIMVIITCCYEFWLKYSYFTERFYFQSNCKNFGLSKEGKKNMFSLADYMFPNKLSFYPYKLCDNKDNLTGGKKMKGGKNNNTFFSNYDEYSNRGAKCITIENENLSEKVFPYNIADYAHTNFENNSILAMVLKSFSFYFLITVLFTRKVLHSVFSGISEKYNKNFCEKPILNNIIFLFIFLTNISGVLLSINTNNYYYLLINLFTFIIAIIVFFANPGFSTIYSFISLINFDKIFTSYEEKDSYYKIYDLSKFYSNFYSEEILKNYPILILLLINILAILFFFLLFYQVIPNKMEHGYFLLINLITALFYLYYKYDNIYNLLYPIWIYVIDLCNLITDIFIAVFIIIGLILTIGTGIISSTFACIYMILSLLFNLFYIPLSNITDFFDILREHSNLLTVLFCMTIIGSSSLALDRNTTYIMGFILATMILIKSAKHVDSITYNIIKKVFSFILAIFLISGFTMGLIKTKTNDTGTLILVIFILIFILFGLFT